MTFDLWAGLHGLPGGGQVAGGENKSTVALYADKNGKKDKYITNVKIMDKDQIKTEIQLC